MGGVIHNAADVLLYRTPIIEVFVNHFISVQSEKMACDENIANHIALIKLNLAFMCICLSVERRECVRSRSAKPPECAGADEPCPTPPEGGAVPAS